MHLGWSSCLYPLEACDFAAVPDYDGAPIPAADLPNDPVLLFLRKGHPDSLLRGREIVARADGGTVDVRVVFVPSVAKWNLAATLVRVFRNLYRYHGTGRYHIAASAVRALGLERAIRTLENPHLRGKEDRHAKMRKLEASLRTRGYDDAKPINVMLCRTGGKFDSLRQGHHRVSACLALGVERMCVGFSAAGALPAVFGRLEFARDASMLTGHIADEWDAGEPEIEGARVFLENKYINDTFLEGNFRGTPCIVKKTSKAVWSIGNEYRLACRMYAAAPDVVPRPLGRYYDCAAHAAAVIMAKVAGPSLTELLARGVTDAQADGFAADIRALAEALKREGILHRDLFSDNLLLDSDGHLKAIDWQLAIDRARYREDPWVMRHWKFRYVVFGVNPELGLGVWNDFHALGKVLALLPQTAAVKDVSAWLAAEAPQMTFAAPPDRLTRFKLRLYAVSLRVQMLLHPRKRAQLARRWHTIMDHPA